jgi:hypothetical protein
MLEFSESASDAVDGSSTWRANFIGSVAEGAFKVRLLPMALLRPHDEIATCPLAIAQLTFKLRCPLSEKFGLHVAHSRIGVTAAILLTLTQSQKLSTLWMVEVTNFSIVEFAG